MNKDELKDEMKNKISMALKDPILQQGFEIICNENEQIEHLREERNYFQEKCEDIELNYYCDHKGGCKVQELEKENEELRNNGFTVSAMTEQQLKAALEKGEQLEKENAELKSEKGCEICTKFDEVKLIKAKEIILKLYNAGRDVLMCRAEEKAYDNLENAINDRSIEQFIKEIEK